MNKNIIVLAAFAFGFGAGYIIASKKLEAHYAEVSQEEIDDVVSYYKEKLSNGVDAAAEQPAKLVEVPKPSYMSKSSLDDNPYEKAKRNYNLVGTDNDEVEYEYTINPPIEVSEDEGTINPPPIRVIDDIQFNEEYNNHDKISLYYYREDDILCEENEELIDDIEGTIGYDAMNLLGTETNVWVRNENLAIDYEIIALNKSYSEDVLGLDMHTTSSPKNMRRRDFDDE